MTTSSAGSRRRLVLGLVLGLAVVGAGVACRSSGDDTATPATVNFTGGGSARLDLDGRQRSFAVVCESTQPGGKGTLLVSSTSPGSTEAGAAVGLQVQVDLATRTGTVGANLGGDPAVVVQAAVEDVTVTDGRLQASGTFTEGAAGRTVGEGSLVVEGCSPA